MFGLVAFVAVLALSTYLGSSSSEADLSAFRREYGSRRVERPANEDKTVTIYSYWGPY